MCPIVFTVAFLTSKSFKLDPMLIDLDGKIPKKGGEERKIEKKKEPNA